MYCPKCGYLLAALDSDCPKCRGAGLPPAPPPIPKRVHRLNLKKGALIFISCLALSFCAYFTAFAVFRNNQNDEVLEAVIRDEMKPRDMKTLFLLIDAKDPAPAVLDHFKSGPLKVRKFSQARASLETFPSISELTSDSPFVHRYSDRDSGEPGMILFVSAPKWSTPFRATVQVDYGGGADDLTVTRESGQWRVTDRQMIWVA